MIKMLLVGMMLTVQVSAVETKVKVFTSPPALVRLVETTTGKTIETTRIARIYGMMDHDTLDQFEQDILRTAQNPGPRVVLIQSGGGDISVGARMIRTLEREKAWGVKIICYVVKDANSMAFNLLTYCDVRLASPNAAMVVHKIAFAEVDSKNQRLTAKRLRALAVELDLDDEPYRRANAAAMHLSLKDYDLFADNETCWSSETLLVNGYLSGICNLDKK